MKVVLSADVDKVGKRGDVKEVSPGFARNFLFPQGLALLPSPESLRQVEAMQRKSTLRFARDLEDMKLLREEMLKRSPTLEMKATEQGHLFGSVTSDLIAGAFRKEGVSVKDEAIVLENPIKDLGIYEIEVRLHPEVIFKAKVWVVAPPPEGGR